MESFHIGKSSENQSSEPYIFGPDDLASIPHPDDNFSKSKYSPSEDDIELPLPPGTSGEDFTIPLQFKQPPLSRSSTFSPFQNKNFGSSSTTDDMSEKFNILPLDEDCQKKDEKVNEFQEDVQNKSMEFLDDSKYSPSKVDSDEENQDFAATKPKVLGKEQAKKRLMAFSLSKQPTPSIKKQNKTVIPAKNKEKPPNPNKGTNVQEQFRATISAIEEEKKKMFQNMPNYLLLVMNELAKSSQSGALPSLQLLEKLKSENVDSKSKEKSGKSSNTSNETSRNKRHSRRSRSKSKSKKRRRSRSKRRSRSRGKRSRSRRRSHSRSRRSRSHSRRPREEKISKSDKVLRESQTTSTKKLFENWESYKAAGMTLDSESSSTKNRFDDSKSRRDEHRRSRSPSDKANFKPIFNYLNVVCKPMTSLQARPADSGSSAPVSFSEKFIKFTRTKPILCWAENPSHASEFYMSKQMLLENCDQNITPILLSIIEKKSINFERQFEVQHMKNRPWYPRENYLSSSEFSDLEINPTHSSKKSVGEENKNFEEDQPEAVVSEKDMNAIKDEAKKRRASLERKISLVNDSYLSEEEDPVKEMIVGDLKVQLDLDMNRVKVRSKWDSDYEGEFSEKESILQKNRKAEKILPKKPTEETTSSTKEKSFEDFDVEPPREKALIENKKLEPLPAIDNSEINIPKTVDVPKGSLVSEYEEFLKMVSVDPNETVNNEKQDFNLEADSKTEKAKVKKPEKSVGESRKSPKLATDWDQESDREEKSVLKKTPFSNSETHDKFLIMKEEKLDARLLKKKKKLQKKTEKGKIKKKKTLKKSSKPKKKKSDDFCSDNSSSDSYDSDSSVSDSNDSDVKVKKKKKKKTSKVKKKNKKDSSSDSDDDSDNFSSKKKKLKQKKKGKKKNVSSESDEEIQNALLKQLDFKKQLIMKKIEEIDSISDRSIKKKEKENRAKNKEESSDDSDSEKRSKSGKKKKTEIKTEKDKKTGGSKKSKLSGKAKKQKKSKSSSESDSDSESSDDSTEKKSKKSRKRKRDSSEGSDSEEKQKFVKRKSEKSLKKVKKLKKDSSSSDSDSDGSSPARKKSKKKKSKVKSDDEKLNDVAECNFNDNLFLEEPHVGSEKPILWDRKPERKKKKKGDDDWEASSSEEECEKESKARESSWDDEIPFPDAKNQVAEEAVPKTDSVATTKKEVNESNSIYATDSVTQFASDALKTSLSNFSFNENSFCSFGQELSRDFFLTDRNYSNSGNVSGGENFQTCTLDPRPFQSVSKDSEDKKVAHSELYSPGHSDSELSDADVNKPDIDNKKREEVYDPLNCDSEGSVENAKIELSSIPLPCESDILLPAEQKNSVSNSENVLKDLMPKDPVVKTSVTSPLKSNFVSGDFASIGSQLSFNVEKNTPTKRQLMSVKGQQKLISKAASVFQDESDEENIEPVSKAKSTEGEESVKVKKSEENRSEEGSELKERKKKSRDRERSEESEGRRRRSRSRESKSSKSSSKKSRRGSPSSSSRRNRSRTPDLTREKREIRSDSFEIEPLKSCIDSNEMTELVQPIPVLTGVEAPSSDCLWNGSMLMGSEFSHATDNLIDNAESFDIYPSEESALRTKTYDKDYKSSYEKSKDQKSKKERRKSRSRSHSPKRKNRSKSPERRKSPRNRSPRRKSVSPKRRDKSPFSPRRRSPKRKSPRRYKSSRSPDKRRKSRSRSPRKRRSRSVSPRKYRSPKHPDESPRKKDSSPKNDYSDTYQNRIPVISTSTDDMEMKLSPSSMRSSMFESFGRHDTSVTESEMYSSYYEGEYTDEFGMSGYAKEPTVNNLITVKNHDLEKTDSPERLSLDQRLELELGVPMSSGSQTQNDQYQMSDQVCPPFQDPNHFQNSYGCENPSDNFYQNQNVQMSSDFNGQYFNGQAGYRPFQQYPSSQNSVLQVGNIVEVVPTLQHPPPPPPHLSAKSAPQIMQVGNVLQVVPSQKPVPPVAHYDHDGSPMVKTQKATAVVAPSSIVPTPNAEAVLNPLIKAIQLERERRRQEKEKRKAEREARRKARQLRREAKLMSVNEKLKKSVQNEGLMLGQEVEDDELLESLDVPSPPIPVEIITVSSPSALPPAGKGILITAGFMPKPPSEKKEVKFADGVCPGEGTSTSGGEDIASPPPKPKLPKEKRFKKKKSKVKKKVKVQIIRQIIQEEEDDDDDLSPPPPPPGDPPPVFFARFPFASDTQFPVYQTQTTTTTLTTVQYPNQTFH